MKSNVIDVAGGTFVVVAVSYATGTAYFNSYFRKLHATPDLFTVSMERVIFEGGRQLLDLVFLPLCWFAAALLLVGMVSTVFQMAGSLKIHSFGQALVKTSIYGVIKEFWWVFGFIVVSIITSISFERGGAAGVKVANEKSCTRVVIDTDDGLHTGCVIYKTEAEVWLLMAENNQKVLVNFPVDKYKSLTAY